MNFVNRFTISDFERPFFEKKLKKLFDIENFLIFIQSKLNYNLIMKNLFEIFNPLDDQIFRLIGHDGRKTGQEPFPESDAGMVADAYKDMLFERTADLMAVSFQRQGRMYTYPPNLGQEAIHIAAGRVMRREDWLVPAFRELGVWLAKGATLKEIFLYFMGHEKGSAFTQANHMLPISVPIGSQLLHATGLGYAISYKKKDEAVFAFIGDGGTSEGDFSEALNFAAVWKAPVIFTVQNNQYAISVPFSKQTRSVNIAVKALAFGMPGIKVDGNDFFAMLETYRQALDHVRSGKGPVLIEALTYRKGAHTTSDDPTKYRTKEEEQQWETADPLERLKKFMQHESISGGDEEQLVAGYKAEIERQFSEAENDSAYAPEDVFRYTFTEMPDELKRQQVEFEKFMQWKERQK